MGQRRSALEDVGSLTPTDRPGAHRPPVGAAVGQVEASASYRVRTGLGTLLYAGCLVFFIIEYLRVHQFAAYTFPVPWPDESQFLWPAIAFAKTGSLYAPQIDASRTLFNHPFGYMIFIGSLFKIFGCSLNFARAVSLLLVTASFVLLARMTANYPFRMVSLLLIGLFLLSKLFVVVGNISRMEPLLLFAACLGFSLLQRRKGWRGLAVLSASPLIHPNGVYFLASGTAYWFVAERFRFRDQRLRKGDAAWLLAGVALWSAYAIYAGTHWQDFQQDMRFEFSHKFGRDIYGQLVTASNGLLMLVSLLCCSYGVKRKLSVVFLLALGLPAWLAFGVGHEMWYQMFSYVFYALFSIVVCHVGCDVAARIGHRIGIPIARPIQCAVTIVIIALTLVAWNYREGRLEQLSTYPWNLQWGQMRVRRDVAYVTESDLSAVRTFLDSLRSPTRTTHVRFYPEADSLLFADQEGDGLQFSQPFYGGGAPDVCVVHTSRALPGWMLQRAQQELRGAGGCSSTEAHMLQQRDGTEAWFYRRPNP